MIHRAALRARAHGGGRVPDETYDPRRIEHLKDLLRDLAGRILRLDAEGRLLEEVPALIEGLGTVRAELFRYEVRATFDTPEVAEHRRIVEQATQEWTPGHEDDPASEEDEGWPPESR